MLIYATENWPSQMLCWNWVISAIYGAPNIIGWGRILVGLELKSVIRNTHRQSNLETRTWDQLCGTLGYSCVPAAMFQVPIISTTSQYQPVHRQRACSWQIIFSFLLWCPPFPDTERKQGGTASNFFWHVLILLLFHLIGSVVTVQLEQHIENWTEHPVYFISLISKSFVM